MAMEEWSRELDNIIARTGRYIERNKRKAEKHADNPEKYQKYYSKVTWAMTLFETKMAEIQAKLSKPQQPEIALPKSIRCAG